MRGEEKTLYSIQYLRALAACMVIPVHIGWTNPQWGQQGVDIFFVISGFIMMYVTRHRDEPSNFLLNRAVRIVPLYWLVTIAAAIIGFKGWGHLLLSFLFVPHFSPDGSIHPQILQGWTLDNEVFFYLVFSGCLLLKSRHRLWALSAALLFLVVSGLALHPQTAIAKTYTTGMLMEFVAGCWLYAAYDAKLLIGKTATGAILLLAGIAGLAAFASAAPGEWRPLFWGTPAALIVAGTLSLETKLPKSRALLLVGSASYAVYLTHYFLVSDLKRAVSFLPLPFALIFIIGGCVMFGVLVHTLIEMPLSNLLKGRRVRITPQSALAPP